MHLMDDTALVEAARNGDDAAWAAIYDRYADKLHDHCHRILRDPHEAGDALHDAFLAASRNLHQLRDPSRLRPWLYSICRHTSLRRLTARDRVDLTDAYDDVSAADVDHDRGVRAEELSELVWAAAAGLNGRDQALLDLHLRQGLEGQDLADAMGTSLNNSYVMLSRMRDQVERSLGALLIARLGREDCEELDRLLAGWDGRFSPLLRKRVARHVDGCETCSEKRKAVVSPLALLAAAPLVPAPAALKTRVISSVRNVEVVDAPHVPFTKQGFAVLADEGTQQRRKAIWVAAVAAAVLLLGGFLLTRGGDEPSTVLAAGSQSSTTARVPRATTDLGITVPTVVGEETPAAGDGATSTTAGGGRTTTTRPDRGGGTGGTGGSGGGSSTTARPATTTTTIDTRSPDVFNLQATGECPVSGSQRDVTVRVKVTDGGSGVKVVRLLSPSKTFTQTGPDQYEVTFQAGRGQVTSVFRSEDNAGNKNNTNFTVPACPTTTTSGPTTTSTTVGPGPTIG